jgi:hypothetical protein
MSTNSASQPSQQVNQLSKSASQQVRLQITHYHCLLYLGILISIYPLIINIHVDEITTLIP